MLLRCAASRASRICRAYSTAFSIGSGPERRALDEFHDEVVGSYVVNLADMRMIEGGYGACFAVEAFGEFFFGNLDGDDAVEARIASFPDFAHTSGADG